MELRCTNIFCKIGNHPHAFEKRDRDIVNASLHRMSGQTLKVRGLFWTGL